MHASLFADLFRRPAWWAGFLAVVAGFVLQGLALRQAALAVVQPLLTLELPLTLAIASVLFKVRLSAAEWLAIVAMSGGLVLLIGCLAPGPGTATRLGATGWVLGIAGSIALTAALIGAGLRRRGERRAAWLGLATGVAFGLTAAFLAVVSETFAHEPLGIFTIWQTYAMAASGLGAMYLLQNAFQAGTLAAAQPGVTLADPVVAIAWGVVAFHERLNHGAWLVGALLGPALMVWGTIRLSRSLAVAGTQRSRRRSRPPG